MKKWNGAEMTKLGNMKTENRNINKWKKSGWREIFNDIWETYWNKLRKESENCIMYKCINMKAVNEGNDICEK